MGTPTGHASSALGDSRVSGTRVFLNLWVDNSSLASIMEEITERENMKYDFENTIGGKLLAEMDRIMAECLEYKGKSLAEWEALAVKRSKQLELEKEKERHAQNKCDNINRYREQADQLCQYNEHGQFVEMTEEFDRSNVAIDEHNQYESEMKFALSTKLMED